MKKEIDNKTRGKAIGFLVWFRNQYKVWTNDTYYKIAEKYGQCNYGTCRNLLMELVDAGYITIWNDGIHKRRFYINDQKYNELVFCNHKIQYICMFLYINDIQCKQTTRKWYVSK